MYPCVPFFSVASNSQLSNAFKEIEAFSSPSLLRMAAGQRHMYILEEHADSKHICFRQTVMSRKFVKGPYI